jgi:hypothetical protein
MTAKFFDRTPENWQDLEEMVKQAFAQMGYKSNRGHKLKTIRGTVEIDVHAIKQSTPIPTVVLCECKHWDKPIPQNVIHGFRTVCSDAGAHFGLIISKKGFQPGAEETRTATNVHLMKFEDFQTTFFNEWRTGAMFMLAMMRDQLLPIFRAFSGFQENGLDLIDNETIKGIDALKKYSIFFGYDGGYSLFFIDGASFPATINDPRGDPRKITQVTAHSHREYLEIAREAVVEGTKRFNLPEIYFSNTGQILNPSNGKGRTNG